MTTTLLTTLLTAIINLGVLAVVFVPLERAFPARRTQRVLRPALILDACFFFGQYLVTSAAALAVLSVVSGVVRAHVLPALQSLHASASHWPAVVQVVVAVTTGDFVVYWFHRACHRFDVLWRFHAVHHTSEHLDWLAAHREHPFDGVLTQLCMNLPAMMLGVHMELLAGIAVFRGMWSIFVHSNVRLPLGPLRWLLGAPELHHWHHARVERTAHNFANIAPWLDLIFGTYRCPDHAAGEERFPLGVHESWPQHYPGMLLRPLLPFRGAPADGVGREPPARDPRWSSEREKTTSA